MSESTGVQDWRAIACLTPNGERLLCVGGSSAQVRAAYTNAWGEVIRDEDRPTVRAISLQRWAGLAWAGQWEPPELSGRPRHPRRQGRRRRRPRGRPRDQLRRLSRPPCAATPPQPSPRDDVDPPGLAPGVLISNGSGRLLLNPPPSSSAGPFLPRSATRAPPSRTPRGSSRPSLPPPASPSRDAPRRPGRSPPPRPPAPCETSPPP